MVRIRNPEEITQRLSHEKSLLVKQKLSFLNLVANYQMSVREAAQALGLGISTGYKWIKDWNERGYHGLPPSPRRGGRPPRLKGEDLDHLRKLLRERGFWTTKEVKLLIREEFGVQLSCDQVRRILSEKLRMRFGKPYPRDHRRPQDAEERLEKALEKALKELEAYGEEEIGIGFVDESSPQTTANTARVWSFERPTIIKNTERLKANAIGVYPLRGKAVIHFGEDSREETFIEFLKVFRKENPHYKAIILILDNFKTHLSRRVREEAGKLGIKLVYLPPYSPDLNPIEFIWKSIKRIISLTFIKGLDELHKLIKKWFLQLAQELSFADAWIERFLPSMKFCN